MKLDLSIIIVHYQALNWLMQCLQSIYDSGTKVSFEIIVVDNDEKKTIKTQLLSKYPQVIYLKSLGNIGYGAGNNLGANKSEGKYLLFLNPDTLVSEGALDKLVNFLKNHSETAIAVPQITDANGNIYHNQCTSNLSPISAIFSHSIIHRVFPNNPIAKIFWYKNWDRKTKKSVYSIEGSAFMIRKSIFIKLKGFDEKFFLYYEETDLCKRLKIIGEDIIFIPKAKVIHYKEKSTTDKQLAKAHYIRSRNYFFIKHYGIAGSITNLIFLLLDKWKIAIAIMIILVTYLLS